MSTACIREWNFLLQATERLVGSLFASVEGMKLVVGFDKRSLSARNRRWLITLGGFAEMPRRPGQLLYFERDDCAIPSQRIYAIAQAERCDAEINVVSGDAQPAAFTNTEMGLALFEADQSAGAVTAFRRALAADSCDGVAWHGLALVAAANKQFDQADDLCRVATSFTPTPPWIRLDYSEILRAKGEIARAVVECRQAAAEAVDYVTRASARYSLAHLLLLSGDYVDGFIGYEWRLCHRGIPRSTCDAPLWDGSQLHGRRILLLAEQGLGDTIQFARFTAQVQQRGGQVIVQCQPRLIELLRHMPSIGEIYSDAESIPPVDVQARLLSLPLLLALDVTDVRAAPYIVADSSRVCYWQHRLGQLKGLKVGIAWQGNPRNAVDRERSIPLEHFAPLAAIPGVQLVSLQKADGVGQLVSCGFPVVTIDGLDAAGAFLDTAAIMAELDLIVTSDTSIAHLAGALGRPCWVALTLVPDWRWMLNRNDSPWYPTLKLFRQRSLGDWSSVFQEMGHTLKHWPLQSGK